MQILHRTYPTALFGFILVLVGGDPAIAADPLWAWLANAQNYQATHVIADLDETLIDSMPRRYAAYRNAVQDPELQGISLLEFYQLPNRYRTAELFENHLKRQGLAARPNEELHAMSEAVFQEYLSGRHLEKDSLIPGAWQIVQKLRQAGATLWFVSARSRSTQQRGSLESLHALGLIPAATDTTQVQLLPPGTRSTVFKRNLTAQIAEHARQEGSRVSLILENEPENLDVMLQAAPDARAVLITGAMSNPKHPIPAQAWQRPDFLPRE